MFKRIRRKVVPNLTLNFLFPGGIGVFQQLLSAIKVARRRRAAKTIKAWVFILQLKGSGGQHRQDYTQPLVILFHFILLRAAKWNKVLSAYITATSKERGSLTKAPTGIKAPLCYRFSAKTLNTVIISKNRSIWRNYLRNMSSTPATVFSAW